MHTLIDDLWIVKEDNYKSTQSECFDTFRFILSEILDEKKTKHANKVNAYSFRFAPIFILTK